VLFNMANNNNDSHWSLSLTLSCLITDHLKRLTVNNLATLFCISLRQNYPRENSQPNHANVLLSAMPLVYETYSTSP